jgi:hypothetical protein
VGGSGTLPHVINIDVQENASFIGLEAVLTEILLHHRHSEVHVYAFHPFVVKWVTSALAALKLAGIPHNIYKVKSWDALVAQEKKINPGAFT